MFDALTNPDMFLAVAAQIMQANRADRIGIVFG